VAACFKRSRYDAALDFASFALLSGAALAVARSARWIDALRRRWRRRTMDFVVYRSHIG
jgi:hypothetical protein